VQSYRAQIARLYECSAFYRNTSIFRRPGEKTKPGPVGDTPAQFAAFLRQDREFAAKKVKASGARLD